MFAERRGVLLTTPAVEVADEDDEGCVDVIVERRECVGLAVAAEDLEGCGFG